MKKIKDMFERVNEILLYLQGEGSWAIKAHERLVLDAALRILDERARKLIGKQLEQRYFIERVNSRINHFSVSDAKGVLCVPDEAFSDLLVKVKFRVDGRLDTAHVRFYKGYLKAIEFKKPGKFYQGKTLDISDVEFGKPSQAYAYVIDRYEHGKNEHDK